LSKYKRGVCRECKVKGLVYITPEFDEVWWNINDESIEIGGTYSFGISGFFYGYVEEVRTLLDY